MSNKLVALLTNNDDDVYCFRLELIQAILKNGYRLLISCPDGPKFNVMAENGLKQNKNFIFDGVSIDRRGMNVIKDGMLFLHYLHLFNQYRPSVILTYTAKPNVYGSLAAHFLHIPVINNITGFGSVFNKRHWIQTIIMWMFKAAYKNSACIMFQNEANMRLAFNRGLVAGKYKLLPGSGVNTDRFPLQAYPEGGNGIEGEVVVFNYIGRILSDKGVDDYIEAAKIIKKRYPKTEFNMIGFIEPTELHYETELKDLEKKGIIQYRGSQKDIKPWIARSHALIHPSVYGEGMSNVLLENASSGRFLITTDNPGCRETVEHGVNGFIFPGSNVEDLVRNIELFLQMKNEMRCMKGKAGRQKVAREFNREIVIKVYLEEINRIC